MRRERALKKRVKQCMISCVQAVHDEPGYSVIYVLDSEDAHWEDTKELVFHIDCYNEDGVMRSPLEIRDFSDILGKQKRMETNMNSWGDLRFRITVVGDQHILVITTRTSINYFNITMCNPNRDHSTNVRDKLEKMTRQALGPSMVQADCVNIPGMRYLVNLFEQPITDLTNKLVVVFEKDKGCLLDFLELSLKMNAGALESRFIQMSESEQDRRLNMYNGQPDKILKTEILDLKDND